MLSRPVDQAGLIRESSVAFCRWSTEMAQPFDQGTEYDTEVEGADLELEAEGSDWQSPEWLLQAPAPAPVWDEVRTNQFPSYAYAPRLDYQSFNIQSESGNSSKTTISISPSKGTQSTGRCSTDDARYKYTVKVVNSKKKTDYVVRKLPVSKRFGTLSELCTTIGDVLKCSNVSKVGFVEPGHGLKGKQHWFTDDADLQDMYENFKSRAVLFWCIDPESVDSSTPPSSARKRPLEEPGEKPPKTKRDACGKKIADVEAIVKQLEEKHGGKFSTEQFNTWAHLLHIKKHTSYDLPPELPYFTGSKKKQDVVTGTRALSGESSSPTKHVNLRSECINQLDKWHSLLAKGAITQQQFDQLQKTILNDIFKSV